MTTAPGAILSLLIDRNRVPIPGTTRATLQRRQTSILPNDIADIRSGDLDRVIPDLQTQIGFGSVVRSPLEETWFEKAHVFPRRLDLGNILSSIVNTIVVWNAFRSQSISWSALGENAGTGVIVTGTTPPPPVVIESNSGVSVTVTVTPIGPAVIDGSLDFTFLSLYTIPVEITGSRLVVFGNVPEAPIRERLRFRTDIFTSADGSEQRPGLRGFPRQEFILDFFLEEGTELTRFDNTMFDWQARVFGVPVWFEPTRLSADAASGSTIINVASTAYADYRVDGLAIIWEDETTSDVLEVESFDATSITFKSPTTRDYDANTLVMPVRTCRVTDQIQGSRARVGRATRRLTFRCNANDVGDSFRDASSYPTFDGIVLLDDPNFVDGELRESLMRRLIEFDNGTGAFSADSPWAQGKRSSAKGFRPKTRAALWTIRRLLHFLSGRRVSFYLPTFYKDLIVTDVVQGGTTTLTIEAAGFAQFIQTTRKNRSIIRLEPVSGATQTRTIQSAATLTQDRESIAVDTAWNVGDIQPNEIARVMFFERVRLSSDDIEILHRDNAGQADISVPVITVFDS